MECRETEVMLGVPFYSDVDEHDHAVQMRGAFEETALGLHNLRRYDDKHSKRIMKHLTVVHEGE